MEIIPAFEVESFRARVDDRTRPRCAWWGLRRGERHSAIPPAWRSGGLPPDADAPHCRIRVSGATGSVRYTGRQKPSHFLNALQISPEKNKGLRAVPCPCRKSGKHAQKIYRVPIPSQKEMPLCFTQSWRWLPTILRPVAPTAAKRGSSDVPLCLWNHRAF